MPKERHEELKKRVERLDSINSLLQIALHDLITGVRPDSSDRVPVADCGTVYHGQMFRCQGEPYVILTREWDSEVEKKNLSATSVHYLDVLAEDRWPIEIRILAERLRIQRDRLLTLEMAQKA
jgi:hypothetical protein